jgi:hypothetical protein
VTPVVTPEGNGLDLPNGLRWRHIAAFALVLFVAFAGLVLAAGLLNERFENESYFRALEVCDRGNETIRWPLQEVMSAIAVEDGISPRLRDAAVAARGNLSPVSCSVVVEPPD